ncbi:MAG: sensor histidine kinase [Spirochaetales bacterium]|nr:sensor histidine kinase [Spirochaetales bacterium]
MKKSIRRAEKPHRFLILLSSPGFWIVTGLLMLSAILHYPQLLPFPDVSGMNSLFGLQRHAVERIIFLLPITLAAYIGGGKGGVACLLAALSLMFPRVFLFSQFPKDAFFETCMVGVTGTLINLWLESRRRQLHQQKRMEEKLRFYTDKISRAHEEERKRIARELHDDTIQDLIVISRQLDSGIKGGVPAGAKWKRLQQSMRERIDEMIVRMRRFIQFLRPPTLDYLGLVPALRELAGDSEAVHGIRIRLVVPERLPEIRKENELLVYRIVQEALNNIRKHSGVKEASVLIKHEEAMLKVEVRDTGKGFDMRRNDEFIRNGKVGIMGMEERAHLLQGTLSIVSEKGGGTAVRLEVPC